MEQPNSAGGTSLVDLAPLSNSAPTHSPTPSPERSNNSLVYEDEDEELEDDIVLALPKSVDATGSHADSVLVVEEERESAAEGEEEEEEEAEEMEEMEEDDDDDDDELIVEPPLEESSARDESALELEDEQPEDVEDDVPMEASDEEEEEEEQEDMDDEDTSEREAIQYEMQNLLETVPILNGQYKLTDRLGEGTFSSVYKAIDLLHTHFDNTLWATPTSLIPVDPITGELVPEAAIETPQAVQLKQQQKNGKVFVALKRIYVTSSPIRIFNELDILNELRGANNVAYLISAIRYEDQVIAVMPFNRHQDFRTYYRRATLPLLRSYFASLFRALASTHQSHIIHRDVKPANFLYDTLSGTGVLCDYGLAQKIGGDEWYEWKAECCHSLPGPSWGGREGRARSGEKVARLAGGEPPGLSAGLHGVKLVRPVALYEQVVAMEEEWKKEGRALRRRGGEVGVEEWERRKPWIMPEHYRDDMKLRWKERTGWYKNWRPVGIVGAVNAKKERVGYLKEDRRPSVRANRAGTRGFRAPEVLLKCPDQTVSLDIWSAGIMLLCFLTRRFPFFNSNDDTEALVELAAIFGRKKIERCAAGHNRTFITNIPTLETPPHANLHALVKSLNPPLFVENSPNPYAKIPSTMAEDDEWYGESELFLAVDLMKRCLDLDGTRRWTAEECLEHPFFDGMYDVGGGELGPRSPLYT